MPWYEYAPGAPNKIGGYSQSKANAGAGWLEGPEPKQGDPKWMRIVDGAKVVPLTAEEHRQLWVAPEEDKAAKQKSAAAALADLPGWALAPAEELVDQVRTSIQGIDSLETAKQFLDEVVPKLVRAVAHLRDLVYQDYKGQL